MIKISHLLTSFASALGFAEKQATPATPILTEADRHCSQDRLIIHIRNYRKGVTRHDAHRVGTIIVQSNQSKMGGTYLVSASMCSRTDRFDADKGIIYAMQGGQSGHVLTITEESLKTLDLEYLLSALGLDSKNNWYDRMDWVSENVRFRKTIASWLAHRKEKTMQLIASKPKEQHA